MNYKRLSILRVPRRPGAGQAMQETADSSLSEQEALKARGTLAREYEDKYRTLDVNATITATDGSAAAVEQPKRCISGTGRITETSDETTIEEETMPRPSRAQVSPEWAQREKSRGRTPWATDEDEPIVVTKISAHNNKGFLM